MRGVRIRMPADIESYLSADRVRATKVQGVSPALVLNTWLNDHPKVAKSLWYIGPHFSGTWPTWPDGLKNDLASRWVEMVRWYGEGMPDPAPASFPDPIPVQPAGEPTWGWGQVMSKEHGRQVYMSHVANGLALELTGKLPWSVTDYTQAHLEDLFSCEYWLEYLKPTDAPDVAVEGYYSAELVSATTPAHAMRFFTSNNLIGPDATNTVARLFGWCRILLHYEGRDGSYPDPHDWWGPNTPPVPARLMIKGSNYTLVDPPEFGHYTMACGGTSAFMRSVLRAVNIPVEVERPAGHQMPIFPTIKRALSHGDDPYFTVGFVSEYPGWPVPTLEEYLITMDQWHAWFDPSVDPAVMLSNVSRRPVEVAVQYQSDVLLARYCDDTAANLDHASGQVYAMLSPFYTLAELEAMRLWDKLAAKAEAVNVCATHMT